MPRVANVLFPADYFEKIAPDGSMRIEYESACAEGRLDVGLFDLELFEERGELALCFSRPSDWCGGNQPHVHGVYGQGLCKVGQRDEVSR